MAESSEHTDNKSTNEKSFIQEKIVKRPDSFRQWVCRIGLLIGAGLLFGTISCVTFVLLQPFLQKHIASADTAQTSGQEAESSASDSSEDSNKAVYDESAMNQIIEQLVKERNLNEKDYQNMYDNIASVVKKSSTSLVSVIAVTKDIDWFDTQYEKEGSVSGVILHIGDEILVLTDSMIVNEADSLEVEFCDNEKVKAHVKATDTVLGLAIVSADRETMQDSTLKNISEIAIGDSEQIAVGNPVLVTGNPENVQDSIGIGYISAVSVENYGVDWTVQMFTTNLEIKGTGCSFLLDMEGKLAGIYPYTDNEEDSTNRRKAMAIDDLTEELKILETGTSCALLGITAQEVTSEISEKYNVPDGLYVTEVQADTPAYQAGIQNGDVITKFDGNVVLTIQQLKDLLLQTKTGKTVSVILKRSGASGYTQLELKVTLSQR